MFAVAQGGADNGLSLAAGYVKPFRKTSLKAATKSGNPFP
jgi:hypothetical protein